MLKHTRMQPIWYFLVCCFLTVGAGDIDFHYLLDQYILICGNMLCNKISEFVPKIPAYLSVCAECFCDEKCVFNGTCCPDKFFSLKLECTNTSIVSHKTESKDVFEDSFLMRVTCPEGTDPLSKANCESNKTFSEKIQYPPVTSSETLISYKNKFCAQCNNESKFEYWIFNSVCDEFVDFNFISSLDEILKTALDKKCKISSNLTVLNTAGCFRMYGYNTIKTCNVTGSWLTYNKDIEWGCLNYNNRFLEFKNVFCYICNPPVKVKEVITDCNITRKSVWYEDYPNFQTACKKHGTTTATYPFKNIYCYLCNSLPVRAYVDNRRVLMYFDASVIIEEKVVDRKYFEYIFEIEHFDSEFMDSYLKTEAYQSSETQLMTNHRVNLTEIYTHYYAMTGNGHFCVNVSTNVIADERHNCGCSDGCHFDYKKPCCIDANFKYSTSCIDGYLVYDGCEDIARDFNILSYKCQNREGSSDIFSSIPVNDNMDKPQGVNYKNIYCAMCRSHKVKRKSNFSAVNKFKPWRFTLICTNVIPIYFHVFLSQLFETRVVSNCNFTLVPNICHKQCPSKSAFTNGNTNSSWACRNFNSTLNSVDFYYKLNSSSLNEYQNIFCAMEESTINETTTLIQQCNVTGRWNFSDDLLHKKCTELPQIDFHYPYKNIFCKMCNEERIEYVNNYKGNFFCILGEQYYDDISFRSLFSFLSYEEQKDSIGHETCKESQVYDSIKDTCRDIVCYPGRVLINETCIPLLPYTSNLGYTLTFGVQVQSEDPITDQRYLLQTLEDEILVQLGKQLNRKIFPFLEIMIMKANDTCLSDENLIGPYLHVSVFLKLFVNVVVNRDDIETKLLEFQKHEFSFKYNVGCVYCTIKCKVTYDNDSLYLPIDMHIKRFDSTKCYLKTTNMIPKSHKYVHSHISSLLQCPQIEFNEREFIFDKYKNILNVPQYNTVLDYYNFYLTRSDHGRICLNTFKSMMVSSSEMSVLQIIILIFTILSLLCLFLTFMTYCLFEQLRTLPGKNNMCLVVALFFAMAFLEFGMNKTNNITLCIVLGGFIHYFWLCTFCCLNVCSFHMYCTFSRNSVYRSRRKSKEQKRLLLYILYSSGLPAIIIIMNILFTNFLKGKELYGYGGKICFISERLSFVITFIVPITIMCLLNVFFFVYSAHSIASTPKLKNDDSSQHNSVNLSVYIKLFTITGSSWVIQIIDSFLPLSPFSVIVSLLNALQGIYIFVAYICNKRVFILYRSLICNKPVIKSGSESRNVTKNETLIVTKL